MNQLSSPASCADADPFPTAETDIGALHALLDGCANPGVSRHGVLLRLSELPARLVRSHHLRLIAAALDPLLGLDRARLFRLPCASLILIWRGDAPATVDPALAALRRLFADFAETATLIVLLGLPRDIPRLREAIASSSEAIQVRTPAQPLDPASLTALEAALLQTDIACYARRRQVLDLGDSSAPALAWEHRTLAVARLADRLAPGIHPQIDPWLFRRLTRTLDRRLLSLLANPIELRHAAPFALDLNVASILAPEFLRLDATLPCALRGRIILAVHPSDVLSDIGAYTFARDFARARAYRLMLRGLTIDWLDVFPAAMIGADLIQLRAAPELDRLPPDVAPGSIVLSKVADAATLAWGQRHGIRFFEGQAVPATCRLARPRYALSAQAEA